MDEERDAFGRSPITPITSSSSSSRASTPSPPPPPEIDRRNVGGRKTMGGRGNIRGGRGGSVIPTTGGSVAPMMARVERRGEFLVPMTGGSVASRERRVAPPIIPTPMTIQTIPSFQDLQPRRDQRIRMAVANERARRRRGSLALKGKGDKDRT